MPNSCVFIYSAKYCTIKELLIMLVPVYRLQWVPGLFPGVKWPKRGVDHPPTYSAEVKERAELYLYSPSGSSWPVLGWTFMRLPLSFADCNSKCDVIGNSLPHITIINQHLCTTLCILNHLVIAATRFGVYWRYLQGAAPVSSSKTSHSYKH